MIGRCMRHGYYDADCETCRRDLKEAERYALGTQCHHGSLRRSCDRCDMEQEIAELRRELDRTRRALAKACEALAQQETTSAN